jgi:hypothetical protein
METYNPVEAENGTLNDDQVQGPRSTSIMRELRVSSAATPPAPARPLAPSTVSQSTRWRSSRHQSPTIRLDHGAHGS